MTVGGNGSEQKRESRYATVNANQPLAIFSPDHDAIAEPPRPARSSTDYSDKRYGVYSNLRLSLTESLSTVMGGRVSSYDYQTTSAGVTRRAQRTIRSRRLRGHLRPQPGLVVVRQLHGYFSAAKRLSNRIRHAA